LLNFIISLFTIISLLTLLLDNYLWSASVDKTIKVWDITDSSCMTTLLGHRSEVTCLVYLPPNSPQSNDSFIASGSMDGDVVFWNSSNGEWKHSISHGNMITCMETLTQQQGNNKYYLLLV
jgi:WD40 repeat protein